MPPKPTCRLLFVLLLAAALVGCAQDTDSIPAHPLYDNAGNYQRVFGTPVPVDVSVVHSIVVSYEWRLNAVTTDDFEFELLVPTPWLAEASKRFGLHHVTAWARSFAARKADALPWYAPKPIEEYELYRDPTSAGYVHMLVDKDREADGRNRVFVSKH